MKEWECEELHNHKDISKTIIAWQDKGWTLHSYQAAYNGRGVAHYFLFVRGT